MSKDQYKPSVDNSKLREKVQEEIGAKPPSTNGFGIPDFGGEATESNLNEDQPLANRESQTSLRKKKADNSKPPVQFMKNNKVIFNGPISWDIKQNKDFQIINGSFFYFKQENLKFKNICAEYDLTLLEAVHILVANAIENGMPEEMIDRYLEVKNAE